jgi:hypothetical protein
MPWTNPTIAGIPCAFKAVKKVEPLLSYSPSWPPAACVTRTTTSAALQKYSADVKSRVSQHVISSFCLGALYDAITVLPTRCSPTGRTISRIYGTKPQDSRRTSAVRDLNTDVACERSKSRPATLLAMSVNATNVTARGGPCTPPEHHTDCVVATKSRLMWSPWRGRGQS